MTVTNKVPIVEYTGDDSTTLFAWDWDMIEDSSINVLVDNENVSDWELQGENVVFDTAPADGALIKIYRRTLIRQPEDYQAFGRFHSEKTELSSDRMILIAQERAGDRGNANAPNGIVGGSNLSITRGEFDQTVVSERGTDAVVPMYDSDGADPPDPGDPDPTIAIWEGDALESGIYSTNEVSATIRFRMDLLTGDPTEASSYYPNYNDTAYTSWCTVDPSDNEYWMRVTAAGDIPPESRYQIYDPWNGSIALGQEFQIRAAPVVPFDVIVARDGNIVAERADAYVFPRDAEDYEQGVYGPYVEVFTFGDIAPSTRIGTFDIEICKDDGTGKPDGAWASRIVQLEAIFNS